MGEVYRTFGQFILFKDLFDSSKFTCGIRISILNK